MNTQIDSGNIGKIGKFYFKYRGITPYPFVLIFIFFAKPTWLSFGIGLPIMLFGEAIRFISVSYAGKNTRKREINAEGLVTTGPYAYTRNPIYLGNILLYSGVSIIANIWMPWFLLLVWLYFGIQYFTIIQAEEAALERFFGITYFKYKENVPVFFPRFTFFNKKQIKNDLLPNYQVALRSERSTFISFFLMLAALYFKM